MSEKIEPSFDAPTVAPSAAPPAPPEMPPAAPAPARQPRRFWRYLLLFFLILLVLLGLAGWYEVRTSTWQADYFSKLSSQLSYKLGQGPSPAIRFPSDSPYDERLGYANLPDFLTRLKAKDYVITEQARFSPKLLELTDLGLYPTYREKTQVGLAILDCRQEPMYQVRFPERTYARFEQAPAVLVQSLLFIENRELLDAEHPKRNPAVEWDRLSKAVFDKSVQSLTGARRVPGGSTLATQIEKYRHSPEGRTSSMQEKLRQMVSASLRAYQGGADTTGARRQIVIDYLNTVPLSAKPGYGEVNGIGDGMWVWYGREFKDLNALLQGKPASAEAAAVYKEALSLMIAQRRPSYYLGDGEADLETLTNSHLRVLVQAGVISKAFGDAALKFKLHPASHSGVPAPAADTFVTRKAANAVRNHLGNLLGDNRLYNVDRLDLTVQSTLDAQAQQAVTAMLRKLRDPAEAKAAGLTGYQLLGNGDPAQVVYSFTLLERGEQANYLRVQADNFDQPLDINEGAKLDLGSTAKLRTLVTYLDIIDQLHKKLSPMDRAALDKVVFDPKDKLTQWALDYFRQLGPDADRSLAPMLAAALERKYSANPAEGFFTGGGLHHFGNFKKEDNNKILSVREALRNSVNLVFVRLMRDVAHYYMFLTPGSSASLLGDADDPRRAEYLAKFADREGREFLARFYQKYKGKPADEALRTLLGSVRATPLRLANIHRFLFPQATLKDFSAWVNDTLNSPNEVPAARLEAMYDSYSLANTNLADRGYLAGVHPLELWVVGYLRANPKASFAEAANASAKERQDVYAWLFNTHRKHAQDKRIAGMLELEAFLGVHRQWKKMGYPFDSLVPSYASALGASADRPAALAELMGIIVNGGVRKPVQRIDSLHFAQGTPYETKLARGKLAAGEQVLAPEVARAVADAIREVVSDGTARRVKSAFVTSAGELIPVGGKTGTGDQRFDVFAPGGKLIESRFVNRSATFVFNIGERYFGSMTAYVHGPRSEDYDFTSALPVQLLTVLAPSLMPMIDPPAGQHACGVKKP
ncbi:transglycosylase domain-containing protein [Massilia sp. TS11]|uniref:transglycosylase domain-containing protein n=1 Tax=Massilia sp. TS11 TaxID=2908003 RepID=UPI001EDA3FF9|nr:transglycosylase domain-containing protein [Massilia sp. TS11]MCG2586005.1 transglycosylase domain-containing protein [Massilia sp. TS11]